jgi:molybdate transport system substrate-binding protein
VRLLGLILAAVSFCPIVHADDAQLSVSAAISLKPAFTALQSQFEKDTGIKVKFNFGASGTLAAQVKAGAPVDLFVSAAQKQMDDLEKAGRVDAGSRVVVARNRLVLIVPSKLENAAKSFVELADKKVVKIAIGQPKTVPAGDYATEVLNKKGLSEAVSNKLVYGTNVRQVLDYVVRGEVDAGLVYATDAADAGDGVRIVEIAKPEEHTAIEYPAVVIKDAANAAAATRFLEFVQSPVGQEALASKGFELTTKQPTTVPAHE